MPPRLRVFYSLLTWAMLLIPAVALYSELSKRSDIWWTPATNQLPLAESGDRVEIYVRGRPLGMLLEQGHLAITDSAGPHVLGAQDIAVRLNNWDRVRIQRLPLLLMYSRCWALESSPWCLSRLVAWRIARNARPLPARLNDMRQARGVQVAEVRRLLLSLANVVAGRSYGMPSFPLHGHFLARFRDEDTVLVGQLATISERDVLMELDPRTFFLTDHYRTYPAVLVRLAEVPPALLGDVLNESWSYVGALPPARPRRKRRKARK